MTSDPSVTVGRNDPCPCGSGKKHKRCCLLKAAAPAETLWARERAASDHLHREMLRFAKRTFGAWIEQAWEDFHCGQADQPYDPQSDEGQIFFPYWLFHWSPDPSRSTKVGDATGGVVAKAFLLENADRLREMERRVLEQSMTQPLSFYEVLSSEPGEGISLRDILTGRETHVRERAGSKTVERGDILYAQILSFPGITTLGGCAPLRIPPKMKADVIALRKRLRRKAKRENGELWTGDLGRFAEDIRKVYWDIRNFLYAPPRFSNTDGDPLAFCTLTFEIESPEAAFEALAPLARGWSRSDLLEDAEYDTEGKLRNVEFSWVRKGNRKIKSWDHTILGTIRISDHSLVAEVNSENRAVRLRAEIEKRLGSGATHKKTVSRPWEEMRQQIEKEGPSEARPSDPGLEELLQDPAVRQRLREHVQQQVESWVDQKVPLLGGRTPRQAVQDPDGREIVEALLTEFERQEADTFPGGIRPDIRAVRRLLDLPPKKR